jgi:prophage DNA circulation protein
MSWNNEVAEEIEFISPYGSFFSAYWRRDPRTVEKKLGIFNIPKFNGDIVQDMGVKSTLWPLTIYFEGLFHHFFANRFMEALKEPGQWEVRHPVEGALILQPMRFQENIDTIEENVTEFKTEWIEPANVERLISPDQLALSILSAVLVLIEDSATLLGQVRADAYALINSTISICNSVGGAMDSIIQELTATDALLFESYQTARAAFNSALANYGIGDDTDDIAAAQTDMAILPTESSDDFSTRFSNYELLLNDISGFVPDTTTDEDSNKIIGLEFGITISLAAVAQITATSTFNSRSEVISAIENLTTVLNNSINTIENIQENFSDLEVYQQYYSATATYTTLIETYNLCFQYLLQQSYNLKVEKIITLKKHRSPLEIAVTEYGSPGLNDENYDLFLNSNELTSNEILLLNPGREVVVYV